MKKLIISLLSIAVLCVKTYSASVTVQWEPVCNTNVTQYAVYFTTNKLTTPTTYVYPAYVDDCGVSRPASTNIHRGNYNYTNFVSVIGSTNTTSVVSNLVKGFTYYFYVSCKSIYAETDPSSEVSCQIPLYFTNSIPSKVNGFRVISIQE